MLRLAADENSNNDVVRGVLRRNSAVDVVLIQDVGLLGADDPAVLDWAAREGRVLLPHDVATITRYAYERARSGEPMPGFFEVGRSVSVGLVIEEVLLLEEYSLEGEWEGQVRYLPLR